MPKNYLVIYHKILSGYMTLVISLVIIWILIEFYGPEETVTGPSLIKGSGRYSQSTGTDCSHSLP